MRKLTLILFLVPALLIANSCGGGGGGGGTNQSAAPAPVQAPEELQDLLDRAPRTRQEAENLIRTGSRTEAERQAAGSILGPDGEIGYDAGSYLGLSETTGERVKVYAILYDPNEISPLQMGLYDWTSGENGILFFYPVSKQSSFLDFLVDLSESERRKLPLGWTSGGSFPGSDAAGAYLFTNWPYYTHLTIRYQEDFNSKIHIPIDCVEKKVYIANSTQISQINEITPDTSYQNQKIATAAAICRLSRAVP